MKGRMKYLMHGISVMLVSAALSVGCTKEKLDDRTPSGYVEIALNWQSDAQGSNAAIEDSDGGRIYFYSTGGNEAPICMDCEYSDREMKHMFRGSLPAGEYHVITMNRNFTNARLLYDDRYDDVRISVVGAGDAVALTKADAALIGEPASVFLTHEIDDDRFPDNILVVKDRETVKTQVSPKSMVKRLTFTITLEEFSADACSGIFGGVSQSIKCSTCQCLPTTARVKFAGVPSETAPRNVFTSSINVFDLAAPGPNTHVLELSLLVDGKETKTTVDLSADVARKIEELESQGMEFSFSIPIDLEIKLTRSIDGDIHASVEGWENGGSGSGIGGYEHD